MRQLEDHRHVEKYNVHVTDVHVRITEGAIGS